MNAEQLRTLQTPLKERYRHDPSQAVVKLHSTGELRPAELGCTVRTVRGPVAAGLHPAAGGDGTWACSGDMLLDALVACAGVTLSAVATAMEIPLRGGTVSAEAEMDFRGTLGVDRAAPVGITQICLHFELDSEAPREKLEKLVQLTERYCVVFRTLQQPPTTRVTLSGGSL